MNARAMEASSVHEFIFGDRLLHARFSMAIELLARVVVANPRLLTTASLTEALAQPPRIVRPLLVSLCESGLLCQHEKAKDTWACSPATGTVTLADVFRSVSESPLRRKKSEAPAAEEARSEARQSVDLLLMQATMAINQVVLQHLQAFDLGRLKAVGSNASERAFAGSTRSYIAEPV